MALLAPIDVSLLRVHRLPELHHQQPSQLRHGRRIGGSLLGYWSQLLFSLFYWWPGSVFSKSSNQYTFAKLRHYWYIGHDSRRELWLVAGEQHCHIYRGARSKSCLGCV